MTDLDAKKKYHNTQLLLQHYRPASWNLELEMMQVCETYPMDYGNSMEESLTSMENIGVSYYGDSLRHQVTALRQTAVMIQLINRSVQTIRTKHPKGELYYQILYLSYLSPEIPASTNIILEALEQKNIFISNRTFFRHRSKAISLLSSVLWGYTSKQCISVLQEFVEQLELLD